jgi:hypothetical protein
MNMTTHTDRIARVIASQRRFNLRDLIEASLLGSALLVTLASLL